MIDWRIDREQEPFEHHHAGRPRPFRGRRTVLSLSMTAMIDVVFLLLIYFMVGTDFRMGERVFRMDVPSREGAGTVVDPFRLDDEPLRIAVQSTGVGDDMYRLRLDGPYPQPDTFEALFEFLSTRQVSETSGAGGPGSPGALFRPEHPIIIQPTRHTRWDHAVQAFNAAARARFTNVTFSKPG